MNATPARKLDAWVEETLAARREQTLGGPFTDGIVSPGPPVRARAHRAMVTALMSLVSGRRVRVTFKPRSSYAFPALGRINIDGNLVDALIVGGEDGIEVAIGVAAHEAAHLLYTTPIAYKKPLRRFLGNLIEDERIERILARERPVLAAPLAAARRALITSGSGETRDEGLIAAVYYLIRSPAALPADLWSEHGKLLWRVTRALRPFPETPSDVKRAVRRIERILPPDVVASLPPTLPHLCPSQHREAESTADDDLMTRLHRRHLGGRGGRLADQLDHPEPEAVWTDAPSASDQYRKLRAGVRPLATALRAAFQSPPGSYRVATTASGIVDRKRLPRSRFSERIFRTRRPVPQELAIALILDLSGSMHGGRWEEMHRLALAFSEAALGLRHLRLYVYGHAADTHPRRRPSTDIFRFATPARGPATSLGELPHGNNNRDGHALRLIGKDLLAHEPSSRRRRIAFHACDGDPVASGYGGQPAIEATREALDWFRRHVGPITLLGIRARRHLEEIGAPAISWDESCAAADIGMALRRACAS